MSDDLVKRAREDAFLSRATKAAHEVPRAELVEALADEIERLRAENARLREALTYYAEMCDWQSPPPHCNEDVCCKIARAALSATQPAAEPLDMTRPGDVEYDT